MNYPKYFGLLAIAALAALLASCQRDPGLLEPETDLAPAEKAIASPPQIAYIDVAAGKRGNQAGSPAIKVMDAYGKHQTVIYKAAGSSVGIAAGPSWASSGGGTQISPWRLAFAEETTTGNFALKTVDVYCSSTGLPTGANASTLGTINDGRIVGGAAWRPGSNEIAFTSRRQLGSNYWETGDAEIYVMDLSGAVTRIYPSSGDPSQSTSTFCVAWSPTGDTVAFDLHENFGNDGDVYNDVSTVVLMKRDGTLLGRYGYADGVKKFSGISALDWSRDGKLALSAWVGIARYDSLGNVISVIVAPDRIFTLDVATGIFTSYFQASQPSWSPDAAAFVYQSLPNLDGSGTSIQLRALTSSSYTVLSSTGFRPAWR